MGRLLGFGNPIHPSPAGCSAQALGSMITIPLKPFLQAWGSGEAKEPDQGWPQLKVEGVCASKTFPLSPDGGPMGSLSCRARPHYLGGHQGRQRSLGRYPLPGQMGNEGGEEAAVEVTPCGPA